MEVGWGGSPPYFISHLMHTTQHQRIFCCCLLYFLFTVFMADLDVIFFADMGSVLTNLLRAMYGAIG